MNSLREFLIVCCLFSAGLNVSKADYEAASEDSYAAKQKKICGQYCLTSVLRYFGKNVQLSELLSVAPAEEGSNLAQLKQLAEAYGLETLGAKVPEDILFSRNRPAILHVNEDHFIALLPDKGGSGFTVVDPPQSFHIRGPKDLSSQWKWEGNCLFIDERVIVLPNAESILNKGIIWYCSIIVVLALGLLLTCRRRFSMSKQKSTFQASIVRTIVILIIVCCASCGSKESEKTQTSGRPKIYVDNPVFEAGVIFDDIASISHVFEITNKGTSELIIKEIKTDCSCTTATNEKTTLAAGETIPLTIVFNLKGRFGKLAERKTVVVSNDPETPNTILTIRVDERRKEFALDPSRAMLGRVPMLSEKILLVRIASGDKTKQLVIDKAAVSSPFIEATEVKQPIGVKKPNMNEYLLKLRLSQTAPPGLLNEVVRIPCSGSSKKAIEIPIRGEIVGPIRTSLSEIQFGLIKPHGKERTKKIQVYSAKPFNILNVTTNEPWLKVTGKKLDGNSFCLEIKIIPAAVVGKKGKLAGAVALETDMSDMNRITIPVYAYHL